MKDEEMAEERATKFTEINYNEPDNYGTEKEIGYHAYYCGFLAGLKAGRPQWHKVTDGDLPTTVGRRFLVSNRHCTMIGYWNGKTFVSADEDTVEIASPIAWCEIPKFEEEENYDN